MSIDSINFTPAITELQQYSGETIRSQGSNSFAQWMDVQMTELNNQINVSETKLEKLATGELNNLHDVMLSLEKAKLSFQLALEVRNKLLEGYQEIMRMQV